MKAARKYIAALALLTCLGCSPSAYRMHAAAVVTVASAHTVAGGLYTAAKDAALDDVEAHFPDVGPERSAAIDEVVERFRPAAKSLDTIRAALLTWLDAVDLALAADSGDSLLGALLPLAQRVLTLYGELAGLLREVGVEAPALPPFVAALAGGAS